MCPSYLLKVLAILFADLKIHLKKQFTILQAFLGTK